MAAGVPGSVVFSSLEEQRSHARSDWHRYNIKARAAGKSAISEADFERIVSSGQDEASLQSLDLPSSAHLDALNDFPKFAKKYIYIYTIST